jgi:hypothetical protein
MGDQVIEARPRVAQANIAFNVTKVHSPSVTMGYGAEEVLLHLIHFVNPA